MSGGESPGRSTKRTKSKQGKFSAVTNRRSIKSIKSYIVSHEGSDEDGSGSPETHRSRKPNENELEGPQYIKTLITKFDNIFDKHRSKNDKAPPIDWDPKPKKDTRIKGFIYKTVEEVIQEYDQLVIDRKRQIDIDLAMNSLN